MFICTSIFDGVFFISAQKKYQDMCDIDELLELADHLLQEMDVMSDKNKEMTETIRERVEKVLKLQNLIEDQTKSELEGMSIIFSLFFQKSLFS